MLVLCFVAVLLCHQSVLLCNGNLLEHPPTFLRTPPAQVFFKENGPVLLECEADDSQSVRYTWKKDGAIRNQNTSNIRFGKGNSVLEIIAATKSDEGYYQCIIETDLGKAFSSLTRVQMAVLKPIGEAKVVKEMTATEGRPFVIPVSNFEIFPKPSSSADYMWLMFADPSDAFPTQIATGNRIQVAENGDLHFAYVTAADDLGGKNYVSALRNSHLDRTIEGNYTRLRVEPGNASVEYSPTLAWNSTSSSLAMVGENVTLRCIFSGKPEPIINWFRKGGSLDADRFILSKSNTELTLTNVTQSVLAFDCMGTNTQGQASHTFELQFQSRPRFLDRRDSPQELTIVENERASFRCDAFAIPEANVVWYFNGQSLTDNPRNRFTISADQKSLTIDSVCQECKEPDGKVIQDTGVIQCNASNIHGYAIGTGYLNAITVNQARPSMSEAVKDQRISFELAFASVFTTFIMMLF